MNACRQQYPEATSSDDSSGFDDEYLTNRQSISSVAACTVDEESDEEDSEVEYIGTIITTRAATPCRSSEEERELQDRLKCIGRNVLYVEETIPGTALVVDQSLARLRSMTENPTESQSIHDVSEDTRTLKSSDHKRLRSTRKRKHTYFCQPSTT